MAGSANNCCPIKPFKSTVAWDSPEIPKSLAEEQIAPQPRSGHRMVCVDHKLFLFGGYNPKIGEKFTNPYWEITKPLFGELWQYNSVSKRWRELYQCHMNQNHGLVSFGCVVSGHVMFHVGGTGLPFGDCSNNWLYACDLQTGTWEKLRTTGRKPQRCYGQAVLLDGNDLYTVGGTTGFDYNMDVHHINIVDKVWTDLTAKTGPLPLARYRHEVLLHKGELLVFGGGQKDMTAPLETIDAFCLDTQTWRSIRTEPDPHTDSYPRPRKCHILVQYQNYVYIHGGCNEYVSFGDMWRLSLDTKIWEEVPLGTTSPRHFHAAAITPEGCLFMHGGVNGSDERLGELVFCWLTVPALKRQSWLTILQESPDLLQQPPLRLYQLGLPTLDIRKCELMPDSSTITPPSLFSPLSPQDDDDSLSSDGSL